MPTGDFTQEGPPVTESDAEALLRGICFKTGPPRTVGVELEWFVHELHLPELPVEPARLEAATTALRALPLLSALAVEPGGQLELSSLPAPSLTECIDSVSADLDAVRAVLRSRDLGLTGIGTDPWHPPKRLLREPRYDAMEAYLDRAGPAGRAMMCSSASVQVCLDAGHEEPGTLGHGRRWLLAHLLGAVLSAAFANSPFHHRRRTGWRSTRQALWTEIEPGPLRRSAGSTRSRAARGRTARWTLPSCASGVRTTGRGTCRKGCPSVPGYVPGCPGRRPARTSTTT